MSKLDPKYASIVAEYINGMSIGQLAAKYGVSESTMQAALRTRKCKMRPAILPKRPYNQGAASCGHGDAHLQGLCRSCYEKDLRRRNPDYAERQRENCRRWIRRNKKHFLEMQRARNKKQTRHYRRLRALKNWGLTLEDYARQLERQDYRCPICGKSVLETKKALHVDHDHATGVWRGLLCFRCNYGLGWFQDDPATLERALNHLRGANTSEIRLRNKKPKTPNSSGIHVGHKKGDR